MWYIISFDRFKKKTVMWVAGASEVIDGLCAFARHAEVSVCLCVCTWHLI